ncbi:NAD-binding protein [Oscillatoriales cyanobacterium LEGE 11467]|uniref:NAD-binding protein n=1 Tax=Zarconia navalis LEGE 11467 TaxID=1828826 RepID=A0A928VY74_9CYAN|nr:NAD(P)-binding protein [Zarconia navalis]MBE9042291.1 NAD-binding protein [Zarconia navalis LEGE 11467]
MKPRIIVCGLGRTGYKIFSLLRQQGTFVVGISNRALPHETENIVVGDARSSATLIASGILDSHTLILASSDDSLNLAILVQARLLNPKIYIVNRLFNTSLGDRVDRTLAAHVSLSVSALAAPVFAFAALGSQAIGQLTLYQQVWPMHEEYIDRNHPWNGLSLPELWDDLSRMLIYYLPARGNTDLVSAVLEGNRVQVGDRLIVATKPSIRVKKSLRQKFTKLMTRLRQLREQTQSAVLVVLTLLLTIFLATLTYTAINSETSFVDALYFSVGMITGAGGQEEVAEEAPGFIKIFTAAMMLVGAGVIGICYALLNDLILGTRFRKLWKAAPIPPKHHYIVCGLGGIGVQTVKQLQLDGCEVVAIECDPNGRYLGLAQSLNVPVIQGDASVPEILAAANIHTCEALVAVTSNDMTNLEIALTAKGLVPNLRVIVRDRDPQFALRVQQVFEFDSVLSPIELAAPAFAAAALGGRVFGNGMTAGSLWIALSMKITAGHPFCGQRVKEAAMQSDFVPLYLKTPGQIFHAWDLLEARLCEGDILYMTIPANRLEQLWRVSPAQFIDLTKK